MSENGKIYEICKSNGKRKRRRCKNFPRGNNYRDIGFGLWRLTPLSVHKYT